MRIWFQRKIIPTILGMGADNPKAPIRGLGASRLPKRALTHGSSLRLRQLLLIFDRLKVLAVKVQKVDLDGQVGHEEN